MVREGHNRLCTDPLGSTDWQAECGDVRLLASVVK